MVLLSFNTSIIHLRSSQGHSKIQTKDAEDKAKVFTI